MSYMSDDDIDKALQDVEYEVAKIEAEITASSTPALQNNAAVLQPPSLANLSLQCKSMTLMDVVNISLNSQNLPTAWAQNAARCAAAHGPSMQSNAIADRACSAAAPARAVARKPNCMSTSWKRCLFAAAGISTPLATMWLHALQASSASSAHTTAHNITVSSALLRFLPRIDPQFADCATRDFVVDMSQGQLQVRPPHITLTRHAFHMQST